MYKVYGKKNEIVWDAETDSPLIRFTDGVAETDDANVAKKLQKLGYKVEGELSDNTENPLSEMSVKELKAYAAEKGIDIGNATKKAEIITVIQNVGNH
jgi:hypothetical protein